MSKKIIKLLGITEGERERLRERAIQLEEIDERLAAIRDELGGES